jgi:hypothetical protein
VKLRERRGNAIPAERSEGSTEHVADHQTHDRPRGASTGVLAHGGEDTYDASVRIALGLLFVILGLAALGAGSFSGGFGDKDLWWLMVGGAALFFGVGMLLRGAIPDDDLGARRGDLRRWRRPRAVPEHLLTHRCRSHHMSVW